MLITKIKYGAIEGLIGSCTVTLDFNWTGKKKHESYTSAHIIIEDAAVNGEQNESIRIWANNKDAIKEEVANWLNDNSSEVEQNERDEYLLAHSEYN